MTLRLPPLALAFDTGQVHLGSRVALSVTTRRSEADLLHVQHDWAKVSALAASLGAGAASVFSCLTFLL